MKYTLHKSALIFFMTIFLGNSLFSIPIKAESFTIESPDHKNSLSFSFISQLRLVYDHLDQTYDSPSDDKFKMEARRIRFLFSGTIVDSDLSYKLQLSTAPGSLEFLDLYFNYKFKSGMQLRYGQFKTPFTSYRMNSFKQLHFSDWAIVSKYFGAERQMGLAMHNGFNKAKQLNYIFGIFTGANARASHAIGVAEFFGTEIDNPSDLSDPGPSAEFHPEIFVYLSHSGELSVDYHHGYKICFSAAWDLDPSNREDFSSRFAPEIIYYYKNLTLMAVGYWGLAEVYPDVERHILSGLLLELACRVCKTGELSIRYADVQGDRDYIDDYQHYYLADAPIFDYDKELTLGLNVDLFEKTLVWQNDVSWLRKSDALDTRDNYRARSQLQLEF